MGSNSAVVTVTCGFDLVTPFMSVVLGGDRIILAGRAEMPVFWSGTSGG